jgi:hypothetical protein
MKKFSSGQEVACINDDWKASGHHPKKGDVVTVDHYDRSGNYICLVGFESSWYLERCFEELPTMEEINEALEVLTETVYSYG